MAHDPRDALMAGWRKDDEDEIRAWAEKRHARISEERRDRKDLALRQLAAMGNGSPLFGALRQSYMESDPAFRARMEAMTNEAQEGAALRRSHDEG